MNKVETKKHWYDKPFKFMYFILSLVPILMFFLNFALLKPHGQLTTIETHTEDGLIDGRQQTTTQEITTLENDFYYWVRFNISNEDGSDGFECQNFINACMWQTTLILNPYYVNKYADHDVIWTPTFLNNLWDNIFNTDIIANNEADSNYWEEQNALFWFFNTILVYETYLIVIYIILKILLFLPNVICYIFDWVERRLGKL